MSQNLVKRPLQTKDVFELAQALSDLGPARLQEMEFWADDTLALAFYTKGELQWLILNLNAKAPDATLTVDAVKPKGRPRPKPLSLFLKSHFAGHSIVSVDAPPAFGRVLYLRFPLERQIEIRLFPHGVNVIATANGKSIALHKPQPLKEVAQHETGASLTSAKPSAKNNSKAEPISNFRPNEIPWAKRIQKLEGTIKKIEIELEQKRHLAWQNAGEWLKENQTQQNAPPEVKLYLDLKKTFSENLNECFDKARSIKTKMAGTQKRYDELLKQLKVMKRRAAEPASELNLEEIMPGPSSSLLAKSKSRGRTFELGDGNMFYVGKSAEDNLRLLRAARPWHLWLHLRDYPGCHGILQKNKGETVGDQLLHEAAHQLLKVQFGDKASKHDSDKFDLLVTECRHVRPIKGDRLGRVNYTDARTLTHRFESQKG